MSILDKVYPMSLKSYNSQVNEVFSNELVKERPSKNSINSNEGRCNETVKESSSKYKPVMEKNRIDHTWNAHSYTGFKFKHPFSMLVVGPTSCGKTHFVRQVLESPELRPFEVQWYYNQPQ